jgi:hypothetical protein
VTDQLDDLRRDGFMVIRAFLDRARTARLLEIAEGLRARYLQCDPLTGRRGFLVSPWHMATIHHPGFYEGAPDWWFGEMLDMVADRRVLDLWQAVVGFEPLCARPSLFMDPPLPHALDLQMKAIAAPDGAGLWHRDEPDPPDDETGQPGLFRGGVRRDDGYLLEIALVPSDAFEYVPGSHLRWDTPAELDACKRGGTIEERTRPLPGGCRVRLQAGDAVMVDGSGIHRGWYAHGVRRRTITLSYMNARYLWLYQQGDDRLRCFLEPEDLERLRPATRTFFRRWHDLSRDASGER